MADTTTDAASTDDEPPVVDGVPVTINGRAIVAREGELVIDAAERDGVYIPRFCYHPRMEPVGMCRMCIVEIDTGRGPALQPSCMLECTPDMKVDTESTVTKKAQDGVLEFLLDQPPARLPGVRQGRRVPAAGPDHGLRAGREPLRRGEAPLGEADPDQRPRAARPRALHPVRPLHPLRQGRRRRPADPLHQPGQRHRGQHLPRRAVLVVLQRQHRADLPGRRADRDALPLQGPPVGPRPGRVDLPGLLGRLPGRRSRARATSCCATWASTSTRSTGAGCATRAASASRRSTAPTASASPLVRDGDALGAERLGRRRSAPPPRPSARPPPRRARRRSPCSAAPGSPTRRPTPGPSWPRACIGTDNVDAQLGDGLPAEVVLGLPARHHRRGVRPGRHRRRARPRPEGGAAGPLPAAAPRRGHRRREDHRDQPAGRRPHALRRGRRCTRGRARPAPRSGPLLDGVAAGTDAGGVDAGRARAAAADLVGAGPVTVILGRQSLAESGEAVVDAAAALLAAKPDTRFLPALRRANVHGALDMGLAPGCCPVGSRSTPAATGSPPAGPTVPAASRARRPRHPAGRGRRPASTCSCCSAPTRSPTSPTATWPPGPSPVPARSSPSTSSSPPASQQADIVLPAAGFAEVDGTTTNIEGRVSVAQPEGHRPGHGPARLDHRRRARPPARRRPRPRVGRRDPGRDRRAGPGLRRRHRRPAGLDRPAPTASSSRWPATPLGPATERRGAEGCPLEGEVDGRAADGRRPSRRRRRRPPTPTADAGEPDAEAEPPSRRATRRAGARAHPVRRRPAPPSLAPLDAYSLRLVATRKLYDEGTLVQPRHFARGARAWHGPARQPVRLRPPRRGRRRPGAGALVAGDRSPPRSPPTPACPAGAAAVVLQPAGPARRPPSSTPPSASPTSASRPEPRLTHGAAGRSALRRHRSTWPSSLIVHRQGR